MAMVMSLWKLLSLIATGNISNNNGPNSDHN